MKSIRKFWHEYYFVVVTFLIWRMGLFLVGYASAFILPFRIGFPYVDMILIPSGLPPWLWAWANFDGVHYLTIVKFGYDQFGTQVFFPLFPLLVSLLSRIISNPLIAGLIISNLSILLAAILLLRMTKSRWAIVFLFAFPTSFFFGSLYTESLFLLLVLLTFSVSKLFSIPAAATRLVGIFLSPVAWIGTAAYSLYLAWRFGQPFFYLTAQSAFNNNRSASIGNLVTPFQVVFRYLKIFATINFGQYDFWIAILEFTAFVFGFVILGWLTVKRKVPLSWLFFSWLAILLPSVSGTFSSMPRYLLTAFPIFAGLAMIKPLKIKVIVLSIFTGLLIILTMLFTRGYWVS